MADPKKMSIEEILAAARAKDGGGQEQSSADEAPVDDAAEASAEEASEPKKAPAAKVDSKDARKMSVAEMMAAARGEKAAGADESDGDEPAADESVVEEKPAAPAKDARKMSVAEMMAAARGEKSKPAAPAKKASKKPAAKAAAASKTSPKAPAAAKKDDGPLDTASILAAARKSSQRGPVSKSEAAAAGMPEPKRAVKPKLQAPPMPEKPAYAKTKSRGAADTDRRGFLAFLTGVTVGSPLAIGFSTLALTNLMWVLGLARYMFPNILTEPPTSFKVGFPGDLAPGQVEAKYKAQFGVWIVRGDYNGQSQIYALKAVCTHLGCTPNWLEGEQKFKCPCHGSGFYKDGINFEGPAPRPLERYAIALADDGQLEVDKSATFLEEKGDWKDPACKVPV